MTSEAHTAHVDAANTLAAAANVAPEEHTTEWSEKDNEGRSILQNGERTVYLETGFDGAHLIYTRDDPHRFGKTHLDHDGAVKYLRGDTPLQEL